MHKAFLRNGPVGGQIGERRMKKRIVASLLCMAMDLWLDVDPREPREALHQHSQLQPRQEKQLRHHRKLHQERKLLPGTW